MIEVLDQLSPVVLESFVHMAVAETGNGPDKVSGVFGAMGTISATLSYTSFPLTVCATE